VPESNWKGIPVFNVIDPGAKRAVSKSKSLNIGVLATRATIGTDIYAKRIKAISNSAQVFSQSCPLLVPLAEEGWTDDPVTELIVSRYVAPLLDRKIDTLVLGCTHYPLLEKPIQKAFSGSVALIDSGDAICEIMQEGILKSADKSKNATPKIHFAITDFSTHTLKLAEKILSPLKITESETVHL
jgi:glutamate racemase